MRSSATPQLILIVSAILAVQLACASYSFESSNEQPIGSTAAPTQIAAAASERGTPDEARAMLQLAVEHYDAVGREQALADFTAGVAPFKDRDLYVGCLSADHIILANGEFPSLVGQSADGVLDADGHPLGQQARDAVVADGQGELEYRWINPVSGVTERKIGYFQKVDAAVVCVAGAYQP